jgi:hypothetical protein
MRPDTLMLVLAIGEVGLRSSLAARLSLGGGDVLTARDPYDPQLHRTMRGASVLIVDAAVLHARGEAALLADPRWRAVIAIGDEDRPRDGRLFHVARPGSAKRIEAVLAELSGKA